MSDNVKNIISVVCMLSAIAIAFVALYCPPVGIIDTSVLWFTAQLMVFVASIIGIKIIIPDVFKPHKDKSK